MDESRIESQLKSLLGEDVNVPTPQSRIEHLLKSIEEKLESTFDRVYPIGSVYVSVNGIDPSKLFGGEWEQMKDRFLLGAGDEHENGSIGGEASHALTEEEMPSHTHAFTGKAASHGHSLSGSSGSNSASHSHGAGSLVANNVSLTGDFSCTAYYTYDAHGVFTRTYTSTNAHIGSGNTHGGAGYTFNGSHSHSVSGSTGTQSANHSHSLASGSASSVSLTPSGTNSETGSGKAHDNMPPYVTCYMWKRVA